MNFNIRKTAQLTGHQGAVFALAAEPGEDSFLSAAGDGWIVRWSFHNPETGRLLAKAETQLFVLASLSPTRVVGGNMNGGIHWIDLENPGNTRNIAHHQKGVFAILPVGENVYTAGGDGAITRWHAGQGRAVDTLFLSSGSLRSLDYRPSTGELCAGASDNGLYFLDEKTLALKYHIPEAHANSVFAVRYHPGGKYLLSGGRDAQLTVWEPKDNTWQKTANLAAHWFTINDIVFSPDGRYFATASRDKSIKIWDAANFSLIKVLEARRDGGHLNSVNRLLWANYRNILVSASDDRTIILWQPEY